MVQIHFVADTWRICGETALLRKCRVKSGGYLSSKGRSYGICISEGPVGVPLGVEVDSGELQHLVELPPPLRNAQQCFTPAGGLQ